MRAHLVERASRRLRRAKQGREQSACAEILDALHIVAPFDAAAVMSADPETLLPTSGIFTGLDPKFCQPFWQAESGPDVNRFVELANGSSQLSALSQVLPDGLEASPRYRDVYAKLPFGDELRVVFSVGGSCLGMAALLRLGYGKKFSEEEIEGIRWLMKPVAELLRKEALEPAGLDVYGTPVAGLVRESGEVFGQTPGAAKILDDLRGGAIGSRELPPTVIAPLARLQRRASEDTITTRVRGASGAWYRLHLAPVLEQPGVHVMSLEEAGPREMLPILLGSFGLSERESEVIARLSLGLTAKEVASELEISTYTAQDHIKSIYVKAGVSSRHELMARLSLGQRV